MVNLFFYRKINVNIKINAFYVEGLRNLMNLFYCQKHLGYNQEILSKI